MDISNYKNNTKKLTISLLFFSFLFIFGIVSLFSSLITNNSTSIKTKAQEQDRSSMVCNWPGNQGRLVEYNNKTYDCTQTCTACQDEQGNPSSKCHYLPSREPNCYDSDVFPGCTEANEQINCGGSTTNNGSPSNGNSPGAGCYAEDIGYMGGTELKCNPSSNDEIVYCNNGNPERFNCMNGCNNDKCNGFDAGICFANNLYPDIVQGTAVCADDTETIYTCGNNNEVFSTVCPGGPGSCQNDKCITEEIKPKGNNENINLTDEDCAQQGMVLYATCNKCAKEGSAIDDVCTGRQCSDWVQQDCLLTKSCKWINNSCQPFSGSSFRGYSCVNGQCMSTECDPNKEQGCYNMNDLDQCRQDCKEPTPKTETNIQPTTSINPDTYQVTVEFQYMDYFVNPLIQSLSKEEQEKFNNYLKTTAVDVTKEFTNKFNPRICTGALNIPIFCVSPVSINKVEVFKIGRITISFSYGSQQMNIIRGKPSLFCFDSFGLLCLPINN